MEDVAAEAAEDWDAFVDTAGGRNAGKRTRLSTEDLL